MPTVACGWRSYVKADSNPGLKYGDRAIIIKYDVENGEDCYILATFMWAEKTLFSRKVKYLKFDNDHSTTDQTLVNKWREKFNLKPENDFRSKVMGEK